MPDELSYPGRADHIPLHKNWARCLTCGAFIESTYRHDFQRCRCTDERTQIFVDGGNDYRRFGWGTEAKWEDAEGMHNVE